MTLPRKPSAGRTSPVRRLGERVDLDLRRVHVAEELVEALDLLGSLDPLLAAELQVLGHLVALLVRDTRHDVDGVLSDKMVTGQRHSIATCGLKHRYVGLAGFRWFRELRNFAARSVHNVDHIVWHKAKHTVKMASGVLAATSSMSTPPCGDPTMTGPLCSRSSRIAKYVSLAMSRASAIITCTNSWAFQEAARPRED